MTELVRIDNQQVVTDSRSVAKHFEKEHRDVLKAIRHLVEGVRAEAQVNDRQEFFTAATKKGANEVSRMKTIYIDERGWQYAVRPGLGNDIFKAFYRKPGRSWHAVRALAWFTSEREAEADLERWAAKKGMKLMEG